MNPDGTYFRLEELNETSAREKSGGNAKTGGGNQSLGFFQYGQDAPYAPPI